MIIHHVNRSLLDISIHLLLGLPIFDYIPFSFLLFLFGFYASLTDDYYSLMLFIIKENPSALFSVASADAICSVFLLQRDILYVLCEMKQAVLVMFSYICALYVTTNRLHTLIDSMKKKPNPIKIAPNYFVTSKY